MRDNNDRQDTPNDTTSPHSVDLVSFRGRFEWACCNDMGEEECDAPARPLVEPDGTWRYMAACTDERHIANAIRLHQDSDESGPFPEWAG